MFKVQIRSDGVNLGLFFTKKLTITKLNQPV